MLDEYHNKLNLTTRVALTRRLHDFCKEDRIIMVSHIDRFYQPTLITEAVGNMVDEERKLSILLGSLRSEYELLVSQYSRIQLKQ